MAVLTANKPGYAVLEINKLESRTTGNMIANAPLATNFVCNGKEGKQTFAENGMLIAFDPTAHGVGNRYGALVAYDQGTDDSKTEAENIAAATKHGTIASIGLVYATEHMYDMYSNALQNFRCDRPTDPTKEATPYEAIYGQQNHFQYYPRVYSLTTTDTFTTDAIDLGTYTDFAAAKAAVDGGTTVYVDYNLGYSKLATTKTAATYGVVEMATTLPDGAPAFKIRVIGTEIALGGGE